MKKNNLEVALCITITIILICTILFGDVLYTKIKSNSEVVRMELVVTDKQHFLTMRVSSYKLIVDVKNTINYSSVNVWQYNRVVEGESYLFDVYYLPDGNISYIKFIE